MMEKIEKLRQTLEAISSSHAPACLACSFGVEDMVLIDMIARHKIGISAFTLDTGRLHDETYELMQLAKARYELEIAVYFPNSDDIERLSRKSGPNGFYDSVEIRKSCCRIRKVEPLKRALVGKNAWITGLRRQQSTTRSDLRAAEYDGENGLYKYNPLFEWSEEEIWNYIRMHGVPYNRLHDSGFPSIGCSPCTRAIAKGEDIRAGRWWWEDASNRECGIHRK